MSGNQPIPPSKRRQAHLLKTQNRFWDAVNSIELPIIIFMQKYFGAYSSTKFWNFVAKMASPSNVRFLPMILYSLGFDKKSKHLAMSLVYFALFSSFGKSLIVRRRPGSYEGVHSPACASTSSFPSRHTISITIVAFFLPLSQLWIALIILSRIMLGMHFLTDCLLGVLFGKLALRLASLIDDPNFSLFVLLLTFRKWSGAYKILSGALPILIVKSLESPPYCSSFVYSPLCVFLGFVWKFVRKRFPPAKIKVLKERKESRKSDSNFVKNYSAYDDLIHVNTKNAKKSESDFDSFVKNYSTNDDLIHVNTKNSKKSDSDSVYVTKNANSYEMLVIELIPISFVVFLISETNKLLFCIRQINFIDNLYTVDTNCGLCTSRFTSLLKIRFFTKILLGIKYVDLFAIDLRDKIASFLGL